MTEAPTSTGGAQGQSVTIERWAHGDTVTPQPARAPSSASTPLSTTSAVSTRRAPRPEAIAPVRWPAAVRRRHRTTTTPTATAGPLRYVVVDGTDVGLTLIERGLAIAATALPRTRPRPPHPGPRRRHTTHEAVLTLLTPPEPRAETRRRERESARGRRTPSDHTLVPSAVQEQARGMSAPPQEDHAALDRAAAQAPAVARRAPPARATGFGCRRDGAGLRRPVAGHGLRPIRSEGRRRARQRDGSGPDVDRVGKVLRLGDGRHAARGPRIGLVGQRLEPQTPVCATPRPAPRRAGGRRVAGRRPRPPRALRRRLHDRWHDGQLRGPRRLLSVLTDAGWDLRKPVTGCPAHHRAGWCSNRTTRSTSPCATSASGAQSRRRRRAGPHQGRLPAMCRCDPRRTAP